MFVLSPLEAEEGGLLDEGLKEGETPEDVFSGMPNCKRPCCVLTVAGLSHGPTSVVSFIGSNNCKYYIRHMCMSYTLKHVHVLEIVNITLSHDIIT